MYQLVNISFILTLMFVKKTLTNYYDEFDILCYNKYNFIGVDVCQAYGPLKLNCPSLHAFFS